MHPTVQALIGLFALNLAFILMLVALRTGLVLAGNKHANEFDPQGRDVSAFGQRLTRAHANYYENLPLIGGVLLLALFTGNTAVTDATALWLVALRAAQSGIHLLSTSVFAVQLRFAAYLGQIGLTAYYLYRLALG